MLLEPELDLVALGLAVRHLVVHCSLEQNFELILDDLLEEQARLKDSVAALRREVTVLRTGSDEVPPRQ